MTPKDCTDASKRRFTAWKTGILPIALVVALTFVVYGHLWRPGCTPYSKHSDLVALDLGAKWTAYRSMQDGEGLPWWKTDQMAGGPSLGDMPNLGHLLLVLTDPAAAAGPALWIYLLAMSLGMYLWGWSLGLGVSGRLFMAVAGLVNFKLIAAAYAGWTGVIAALAMYPVLLTAVTYVVRRPGVASTAVLGVVGAPFLISGHPQFLYYTVLLAASYVLMDASIAGWRRDWRMVGRQALGLTAGTVLAIGIMAPLLMSLAADRGLITRSNADYDFFLGGHHLQLQHWLTFLYPEWLGSPLGGDYPGEEFWEDVAYFGLIPLILAPIGIVLGRSRPAARWLAASAVVCLLLTADTPVNRFLFDWLPGYATFRNPNRFLFFVSLLGIALAGVGFEELLRRWRARRPPNWLIVTVTTVVLSVMVVEGIFYARRYVTMRPRNEVVPQTAYAEFFAADADLFRIAPLGRSTINYGWAGPMRLQLVTGYDPCHLRHYQTYFGLLEGMREGPALAGLWTDFTALARPDMLDALNVKYIVAPNRLTVPSDRYELVAQFHDQPMFVFYQGLKRGDIFVYRNQNWLPRVFWVDRVVNVVDEREMIDRVRRNSLRDTAVVLEPGDPSVASAGSSEDRATVNSWRAGDLTIDTSCAKRRFLVLSEVWHPGWRATVDGQPTPLHRTDIALMGLWVDAGRHEVHVLFRPVYWNLGLVISGLSGGVLLILFGAALWRGRKGSEHPQR